MLLRNANTWPTFSFWPDDAAAITLLLKAFFDLLVHAFQHTKLTVAWDHLIV